MNMRKGKCSDQEEGFTLFIVAVLLVVAAMIATTAMQQSNRDMYWVPKTDTQENMSKVVAALEAYQREYKKLPCVAARNTATSAATYGQVMNSNCAAAGSTSAASIRVDAGGGVYVRIGVVPFKELQLQQQYAEDAWGNKLLYAVTERLTNTATYMGQTGAITVQDASGTLASDAAFVVLSFGVDRVGGYRSKKGTEFQACGATAGIGQENCDADAIFRMNAQSPAPGASHYDDQLVWKQVDAYAQSSP
jgi:hypothetical protein